MLPKREGDLVFISKKFDCPWHFCLYRGFRYFNFLLCFHLYSRALIFVYFVKHGLKTRRLLDGSPYTNYCHVSFGYRYIDLPNNKFLESCKGTPHLYLLNKTKINKVCINFLNKLRSKKKWKKSAWLNIVFIFHKELGVNYRRIEYDRAVSKIRCEVKTIWVSIWHGFEQCPIYIPCCCNRT